MAARRAVVAQAGAAAARGELMPGARRSERRTAAGGYRDALAARLVLRAAQAISHGTLEVVLPAGRHLLRGAAPGPSAVLEVRRPAGLSRLLARGDIGFAEAYMAGDVDTPDLEALLELGARNERHLARALRERPWFRIAQRIAHLLRRNTRTGSRRNIAYHYDLGNDFYRLWLDRSMTYSAALFEHPGQALEDAQAAKYRRLLSLVDPRPGEHLLEIGCGWGGFAELAARERGCRVTGLTLSREQHDWARERMRAAGLDGRVQIRLEDYRDVKGRFDHVASVEMFEAVGERYWDTFFATVARRLAPGGRAAMQVITIDDEAFEHYRRGRDFIQRYIFPGGMLPSISRFAAGARGAGLEVRHRELLGAHYARTLERWHRRVVNARVDIRALGFDERFLRMWRYYLAYCRAGFVTGRVDLLQALLVKPG